LIIEHLLIEKAYQVQKAITSFIRHHRMRVPYMADKRGITVTMIDGSLFMTLNNRMCSTNQSLWCDFSKEQDLLPFAIKKVKFANQPFSTVNGSKSIYDGMSRDTCMKNT
jgi:hypothetical protein